MSRIPLVVETRGRLGLRGNVGSYLDDRSLVSARDSSTREGYRGHVVRPRAWCGWSGPAPPPAGVLLQKQHEQAPADPRRQEVHLRDLRPQVLPRGRAQGPHPRPLQGASTALSRVAHVDAWRALVVSLAPLPLFSWASVTLCCIHPEPRLQGSQAVPPF